MNASDGASNSASQGYNITSQALAGNGSLAFPLPGTGIPAFNYATALQQYHFQQSLAAQQLLAQQQAVAHSVSIKAAAEQAAARAAEISKLLQGEKNNVTQEKAAESAPKRLESESHSQSPSSRFSKSKSKSLSPVKYGSRHEERKEDSPRYRNYYRRHRHFSSRYDSHRDFYRSSYRRDAYHSGGRRSYLHYRKSRSRSRSRGRSPSRSRAPRYNHYDFLSHRYRHVRSPSLNSRRRRCTRISRSPISKSDISSSPKSARIMRPRKPISRESLSSSKSSQSRSTTSLFVKGNIVDHEVNSSEINNACKQQEQEARSHIEQLSSPHSNSSSSSTFISTDYPGERNTQEHSLGKAFSIKLASDPRDHSSSARSGGGSVRKASVSSDDKSITTSSASQSTADMDYSEVVPDHQPSIKCAVNGHDDIGIVNNKHKKLHGTMKGRRIDQEHMKSPSVDRFSLSTEDSASDHISPKRYPDEGKIGPGQKINMSKSPTHKRLRLRRHEYELPPKVPGCSKLGSVYSKEKEKYDRKRLIKDHGASSEDTIEVEDGSGSTKQEASNHEVDTFERPGIPGECAIYPLPEPLEIMDGNLLHLVNFEEANQEHDFISAPALPDRDGNEVSEQVSISPNECEYPKRRSKRRSRSREMRKKHAKWHHKSRRKEESDEDDYHKKDFQNELKLRRFGRNDHRHCKNRKERKRKRKNRYTSSSDQSSPSSDNKRKEQNNFSNKKSKGSRKKGRHSPTASSSSS